MEHNQQSFPSIFAIVLIKSKTSKYNKVHFAIDTIFAYMKTLHANTCCQVYLHKVGFSAFYPKLNPKGENLGETLCSCDLQPRQSKGPCSRPWRVIGAAHRTTATCQF